MRFYIVILLIISCKQEKYTVAEDALDAAREYKNACLKGDFTKAQFYITPNDKNSVAFKQVISLYNSKDREQKKEYKEASVIVLSNKEIDTKKTQIIVSNSYDKITDTLNVVQENGLWLVDLTK